MKNILSGLKANFSRDKFCVGLDIGTSSVKIAKLKFTKDTVELCGFDVEPSKHDLGEVLGKLRQLHEAGLVNISVSGAQTVIRYAAFPKMAHAELRQALKFEAQKHIPFSVSEVNIDGCILKSDLPDNKMLVLIAAAKKELVSMRLKLVESAGLMANLVDMDSVALINAFNFNNPTNVSEEHQAVALLNIGASFSSLNILEDGIPRLSRDMHIASNNFNQKIMDIFGLDFNAAELLKLAPDSARENKVRAAVESVLANLAGEIRTSFDYYESQNALSVSKIFLSGGGAKFSGFKEMLTHFLSIEVEDWDPLKKISICDTVDAEKLKSASGQLAVSIGLALRP